ncbi:MAG: type II toxin-antitoxin system PemK/MazF family toxin [Deltaproteobacteria bacterium]
MTTYVPQKGDFITVTFDPQSGHEQRGRRPALVVSNSLFNRHTGLAIVCPLTNTDRSFPFHVAVVNDPNITGFVMVEQVKSIDFRTRKAKRIGRASVIVLEEVLSILDAWHLLMTQQPAQEGHRNAVRPK